MSEWCLTCWDSQPTSSDHQCEWPDECICPDHEGDTDE